MISLKIDWYDLLAVQGTLRSLLQHHISKASILRWSAFFSVHLSQLYVTIGKTIALTIRTFVCRGMSLLSTHYVCCHFPANEQSSSDFMAALTICSDFRAQEEEICHYFHLFPFYWHAVMGVDAMILILGFLKKIFSLKPTISVSSFTLIKRLFSFSLLSAIRGVSSAYLRLLIFLPAILI